MDVFLTFDPSNLWLYVGVFVVVYLWHPPLI